MAYVDRPAQRERATSELLALAMRVGLVSFAALLAALAARWMCGPPLH